MRQLVSISENCIFKCPPHQTVVTGAAGRGGRAAKAAGLQGRPGNSEARRFNPKSSRV
jgi:hypothetical protein